MRTPALRSRFAVAAALAVLVCMIGAPMARAATIQIVNIDGAFEGFNDNTAVAPIGGNPGTTRGAQRLNVFNQAAAVWGGILSSSVVMKVDATMDPLTPCTATSGVLGSTGSNGVFANFTGAEFANTWYPGALANKQRGADLDAATSDMRARFNSDVDNSTCLGASNWYYGYDHNEGMNVDLLAVVLHEIGHGLGFATFTDGASGAYLSGRTDVFAKFLYDDTQQKYWDQLDDAGRAASAINTGNLVWRGGRTANQARNFLGKRPFVMFEGDAAFAAGVAGARQFGTAQFGPALTSPPVIGDVVYVVDPTAPTGDGCETPWTNEGALVGKVALIDRGVCTFAAKAVYAENVGAIAVIIVNNVASPAIVNMAGTDLIGIPTVSITQADGVALKNALLSGPVTVTMGTQPPLLAGSDNAGWVKMYSPNPLEPGSSVSHFDVSATPNLLMEPAINTDLTSNVDLTRYALEDIGWFPRALSVLAQANQAMRLESGAPNPFRVRTSIHYTVPKAGMGEMGIYDVSGRMVKRVMRKSWLAAGGGSIIWDATDEAGSRVAPGVYMYRMQINGESKTQRIVVAD